MVKTTAVISLDLLAAIFWFFLGAGLLVLIWKIRQKTDGNSPYEDLKEQLKEFARNPFEYTFNSEPALALGDALENPVSRTFGTWFKSPQEKQVDNEYGPNQGWRFPGRKDLPPGVDKKGGVNITNPANSDDPNFARDVFNPQPPEGIATRNPPPGPTTTSGRVTAPSVYRSNAKRAVGSMDYSGKSNPLPPNNNTGASTDPADPNYQSGAMEGAVSF